MSSSPLAEKRVLISLLKRYLTGRRAYSDSIYITKSRYNISTSSSNSTSVNTSAATTACSTPLSEDKMRIIHEKVFSGIGC